MLPRDSENTPAATEVDAQALFDSAHADSRSGDEITLFTRDEEALLKYLDTPDDDPQA